MKSKKILFTLFIMIALLTLIFINLRSWKVENIDLKTDKQYEHIQINNVQLYVPLGQWNYRMKMKVSYQISKFVKSIPYNDNNQDIVIIFDTDIEKDLSDQIIVAKYEDIHSVDFFFSLFVKEFGTNINLGEAYGQIGLWYKKAHKNKASVYYDIDKLKDFYTNTDNQYLLNFHSTMFQNILFDSETVEIVKQSALAIADMNKEQKWNKVFDDVQSQDVHDWLKSINIQDKFEELGKLQFSENIDDRYPYVVINDNSNWYVCKKDIETFGYEYMIKGLADLKELAEIDFSEICLALDTYITDEVEKVNIYTNFYTKGSESRVAGEYKDGNIYLYKDWDNSYWCIAHEYVHHLTIGFGKMFPISSALSEAVAEEIAAYECNNYTRQHFLSLQVENGLIDSSYMDDVQLRFDYKRYMKDTLIKYNDGFIIDKQYFSIGRQVVKRQEKVIFNELSYEEAASLIYYLTQVYGREEAYSACRQYDTMLALCDKEFEEIYKDWREWLVIQ